MRFIYSTYFIIVLVSSVVMGAPVSAYCDLWGLSGSNCPNQNNPVYLANKQEVLDRQGDNDFSASDSFYLTWDKSEFEQTMIMPSASLFPDNSISGTNEFPTTSFRRSLQYNKLQKQLISQSYQDYRYGAILDYVLLTYLNHDPDFTAVFSIDYLKATIGAAKNGNPSAEDILDHIVSTGVCKVTDYNAHGTSCQKYRVSGYNVVGARTNGDLASAVRSAPVYVEVGVNPYAYQLYSKYSTQPLKAEHNRPSIAGVLTGYSVDAGNPYWELYTRRHGLNNNEVRIKLDGSETPFGHITSAAVTMETNEITYQNSTYVIEYVQTKEDLANVPYYVTTLHILDNSLNDITMLDLQIYTNLETLIVGNNALNGVITLRQPARLGSITIGENSLSNVRTRRLSDVKKMNLRSEEMDEEAVMAVAESLADSQAIDDDMKTEVVDKSKPNTFIMKNQAWIRELVFNKASLNGVTEFVMMNCSALRSITIAKEALQTIHLFHLENLPQFTSLIIGDDSLTGTEGIRAQVIMEDLPKLKEVMIGNNVFTFFSSWQLHSVNKYLEITFAKTTLKALTVFSFSDVPQPLVTLILSHAPRAVQSDLTKTVVCTMKEYNDLNEFTRNLVISSGCLNDLKQMDLSLFLSLKTVEIGSNSCRHVQKFIVEGMQKLHRIVIGDNSFTLCDENHTPDMKNQEDRAMKEQRQFRIVNNHCLYSIVIGKGSFSDYTGFILEDSPSLYELMIGEVSTESRDGLSSWCFFYATSFVLENLPKMKTIMLGNDCFNRVNGVIKLIDLPSLVKLTLGDRVLEGQVGNSVVFRNMKELNTIYIGTNVIGFAEVVTISDVPAVKRMQLTDSSSFYSLRTLQRGKQVNDLLFNGLNQRRRNRPEVECLDRFGNVIVDEKGQVMSKCPH